MTTQNVQLHEMHMHAKNEVAMLNIAKVMTKVKVLGQTDRVTDRMTDRPKTIYPLFFEEGGIQI